MAPTQYLKSPRGRRTAGNLWMFIAAAVAVIMFLVGGYQQQRIDAHEAFRKHLFINSDSTATVFTDLQGVITHISPATVAYMGWHDAIDTSVHRYMGAGEAKHRELMGRSEMKPGDIRLLACRIDTADGPATEVVVLIHRYQVDGYQGYMTIFWPADRVDFSRRNPLSTEE